MPLARHRAHTPCSFFLFHVNPMHCILLLSFNDWLHQCEFLPQFKGYSRRVLRKEKGKKKKKEEKTKKGVLGWILLLIFLLQPTTAREHCLYHFYLMGPTIISLWCALCPIVCMFCVYLDHMALQVSWCHDCQFHVHLKWKSILYQQATNIRVHLGAYYCASQVFHVLIHLLPSRRLILDQEWHISYLTLSHFCL